jgi:hypothetical protein
MNFHQGLEYQRGRGIGSLFTGLFRTLFPIAKTIGKRVLQSDFVKNVSSQALDAGKSMIKNIAADALTGKNIAESASEHLESAKKKIGETIRGSGRKRKHLTRKTRIVKTQKIYNLLE